MFYDNYVRLCNSVKKSPSAVAIEIGIAKPTVSRWKSGSKPNHATLLKIADYFNVPVSDLTGEAQKEKPPAQNGELDNMLIDRLVQLTPDELEKVDAFVQGLIAARGV